MRMILPSFVMFALIGLAGACVTHKIGQPVAPVQFTMVADSAWSLKMPVVGRERLCDNGRILQFECRAVDLLAFLPVDSLGPIDSAVRPRLNGIWGWTDTATGREFALAGMTDGTAFVEITDPVNPRYLGKLPLHAGTKPETWREIKAYKNHAFIVAQGGGRAGMQVFDLTELRHVTKLPQIFRETAFYDRVGSAHTIAVNEMTGFVYLSGLSDGGETCGFSLHMVDVRSPRRPMFAGCYIETLGGIGRDGIHDTQCVVYHGPDRRYRGREICFNAAFQGLGIADVTNKRAPKLIGVGNYFGDEVGYGAHSGWLSEDHRHFFLQDEATTKTGTIVFDLADLEDPVMIGNELNTTEHNLYIRGHYAYQGNYFENWSHEGGGGLRILDIRVPKRLTIAGYFRLHGAIDGTASSWGTYPFFGFHRDIVAFPLDEIGLLIVRHHPRQSE